MAKVTSGYAVMAPIAVFAISVSPKVIRQKASLCATNLHQSCPRSSLFIVSRTNVFNIDRDNFDTRISFAPMGYTLNLTVITAVVAFQALKSTY